MPQRYRKSRVNRCTLNEVSHCKLTQSSLVVSAKLLKMHPDVAQMRTRAPPKAIRAWRGAQLSRCASVEGWRGAPHYQPGDSRFSQRFPCVRRICVGLMSLTRPGNDTDRVWTVKGRDPKPKRRFVRDASPNYFRPLMRLIRQCTSAVLHQVFTPRGVKGPSTAAPPAGLYSVRMSTQTHSNSTRGKRADATS